MVIGCSTILFEGDYKLQELEKLSIVRSTGIKYLELSDLFNSSDPLFSYIKKYDLKVFSIHSEYMETDISSLNPDKKIMAIQNAKRRITSLDNHEGKLCIIHPGGWYSNKKERHQRIKNCISSLIEIIKFAYEKKIKIAIENLPPDFFGDNIDDIELILKNVKDLTGLKEYIGICLDTGHASLTGSLEQYVCNFKNNIFTVHLHDNLGDNNKDRSRALDDIHCPPGCGIIDWKSFFKDIEKINYKGAFIFEIKADSMDGMTRENLLETVGRFIKSYPILKRGIT